MPLRLLSSVSGGRATRRPSTGTEDMLAVQEASADARPGKWCTAKQKRVEAFGPPLKCCLQQLLRSLIRRIGRQNHQSTIDRNRLELDRETDTLFVRECGADLGPALLFLAVFFVLLDDGKDVEVSGGGCCGRCCGRCCGLRSVAVFIRFLISILLV
jgi:hypothetical protein